MDVERPWQGIPTEHLEVLDAYLKALTEIVDDGTRAVAILHDRLSIAYELRERGEG